MPKKGPAIPISPEWKARVLARIDELGISQNELARRAKITKSSLSATLAPEAKQSTVMREIHKALGWEPPPTITKDSLELMHIIEQLPERDQGEILGLARERLRRARSRQN
jgi:lambda repressor-like predicted transcriptional regulator